MSQKNRTRFEVKRMSTETDLLALRDPWSNLLASSPDTSPFLTWHWLLTWWKHFGEDGELWLLTAWEQDERLAGLIPLMLVHDRWGLLRVRRMTFMFYRPPVHLDALAAPKDKEDVCKAFLTYLTAHKSEWDMLDLKGVAEGSILRALLAKERGCKLEREPQVCPIASLPQDWDTYLNRLHKKLRRNLRYFANRLERENPDQVSYHQITTTRELSEAVDLLAILNSKRRHDMGCDSSFDDERFVHFNHEIAKLALDEGWLRLFQLRVGNQVIATLLCYCYQGVYYAYHIGFDPDWRLNSPGRLLIAHVIRQAIKEDSHTFDWLRGADEYKLAWTDQVCADAHILLGKSWRGYTWLYSAMLFEKAKCWAREHVPEDTRERVNRFLSRQKARARA